MAARPRARCEVDVESLACRGWLGGMAGYPAGVLGAGRPGIVCGTLLVVSRLRRWALVTFSLGHF
eukprot:scaffold26618_cov107-Isochrysis_galbana.AAC.1